MPGGGTPRRVCLFAGYDIDGLVDDYVVAAISELSRFADVFYLADGYVSETELAKLAPYTKGAWSQVHGAYDFGSAALLAETYVGWDVIATYDELIITNDSYYVLRPLDEMFARMDAQDCDWWGLQATKRDHERPVGGTGPADVLDDVGRCAPGSGSTSGTSSRSCTSARTCCACAGRRSRSRACASSCRRCSPRSSRARSSSSTRSA